METGLASDCVGLEINQEGHLVSKRPMYAGKVLVDAITPEARPQMAALRPNVLEVEKSGESKKADIEKVTVGDFVVFWGEVVQILEIGMDEDYFDVAYPAHEVAFIRVLTGERRGQALAAYLDDGIERFANPVEVIAALEESP